MAGCSHIPLCMAGARTSGHEASSSVEVNRSSAIPCASFASVFAVAGATTATSASCASRTCGTPPDASHRSVYTRCSESAANVAGPTNRSAERVITTRTVAPRNRSRRTRMQAL